MWVLGGVANQGREWQKDKKGPSQKLQAPRKKKKNIEIMDKRDKFKNHIYFLN